MAISCALAVSAIYYHQPLLPQIASTFGVTPARGGAIATLTQLGYAVGLLLVVPLADFIQPRKLAGFAIVANATALLACAFAPTFSLLAVASLAVGVTAVSAQIIIPSVAGRATPARRGRVVGLLLGGLSSGVLLARLLSGVVGAHFGWRAIFVLASIIDILLVTVLSQLPTSTGLGTFRYRDLLRSLSVLIREERVLRVSAASGFLTFAAFNALWATLATLLAKPPYGFGPGTIGAFGFIGLSGLMMSPSIGAAIDRIGSRKMFTAGAVTVGVAFVCVAVAGCGLSILIFGMILLDVGSRVCLVANQSQIYALRPDVRSRLDTVFFVSCFLGAAMGAALGAYSVHRSAWPGLAALGLTLAIAAAAVDMLGQRESSAA
jgi:predicted MFS family arabinose efflux permease